MYNLEFDIEINGQKLNYLDKVEIHKSVNLLAQTATVDIPAVHYNVALKVEDKFKVGDSITIKLGYNGDLKEEFKGYVQRIDTDNDVLRLNCEDSIYQLRRGVKDKSFKNTSIQDILNYCLQGMGFKTDCRYNLHYDKFTIRSANAFDVLAKIKQETSAHIYMVGDTLHIHEPYTDRSQNETIVYDFAVNIESSDLKYRKKDDRKIQVTIRTKGKDGKTKNYEFGSTGGEVKSFTIQNPMSEAEVQKVGKNRLNELWYDGYEGSVTGWLLPYCEPTDSVKIVDKDYPYKEGVYYASSVTTSISSGGGVRKVELSIKL